MRSRTRSTAPTGCATSRRSSSPTGNALNIIVGTPATTFSTARRQDDLMLGLDGADTLNGGAGNDILVGGPDVDVTGGTYADNFNNSELRQSNGTANWGPDWVETGDSGSLTTQARSASTTATTSAFSASRQWHRRRRADPAQPSTSPARRRATLSYRLRNRTGLDAGETRHGVRSAADGVNFVQVDQIIEQRRQRQLAHRLTSDRAVHGKRRHPLRRIER